MADAPVERWIPPGLQRLLDANPNHAGLVDEAFRAGLRSLAPYVTVTPGQRSGQPCINRARIPVDGIAGQVWAGDGVDEVAADFDLTRADVLVACWYAGSVGLPGRHGLVPSRTWRRRWGRWAAEVRAALWHVDTVDYNAIPDPPSRDEATDGS